MMAAHNEAYAFFLYEGFLAADKNALPLLRDYQRATMVAEMGAALILAWSFKYNGLYKVLNGILSIVYFDEKLPVYFTLHRLPETPENALRRTVDALYDLSRKAGLAFLQIRCVEERFLKEFEAIDGYEIRSDYRDRDSEYAYRPADFLNMAGHINEDKRWRYNKALRKTDIAFIPVTEKNIGLCVDIQSKWCCGKNCEECASFFGCEKKALEALANNFDERFYKGLLLYSGSVPEGYGIGELLNPKVAVIYFGKSFPGDYLFYIVYTLIKRYFSSAEYINLDSDVGNPGIRMFKTHLGVYELWRKYSCAYRKKEEQSL
jgi:hypothetical protein